MAANKNKILVPTYRMEENAFYMLLRVRMQLRDIKNINGVGKDFFSTETYQNVNKILSSLKKRDLIEEKEGNILIREGLAKALDRILDSPQYMNFQNALLHEKGEILSFYYADNAYVGVLLDKDDTVVVSFPEEEALYVTFQKQLEDELISTEFQYENWDIMWRGTDSSNEDRGIRQPKREARITHSWNKMQRENLNTIMVTDDEKIQVVRGLDSMHWENLERETVSAQDWYGVICRELHRLKTGSEQKSGKRGAVPGQTDKGKEKSEYRQITEIPGFPKSRIGFVFWSMKQIIKGFPKMITGMVKKKSLALLLYPLWGLLLLLYNLFMTCYYNDTFMFHRNARLGNLSPYLMAGIVSTPSPLKGLHMDWGLMNTSFLVWPLMMMLTLLGRQLILQLKQRKISFFKDLLRIPRDVRDCLDSGYGKGKSIWIVFAVTWVIGFIIMNPITIFLSALLLLLFFVQGTDNEAIQLAFLWECAGKRKKIDAGKRPEPDSRKYRMMMFHGSIGIAVYGLVSLLLWFVVNYNWWVRLAVTILMILFALIQVFLPGSLSGRLRSKTTILFLLFLTAICTAAIFGGNASVVLADDGGWTESGGSFIGLLQNAGFSTIFAISVITILLAMGFAMASAVAAGLIIGGGTFLLGLSNTAMGDYVRLSARQFINGVEDGERKTELCAIVELTDFASSIINPSLEGTDRIVFQGIKTVGGAVSKGIDYLGVYNALSAFVKGDGDFGKVVSSGFGPTLDYFGSKWGYEDLVDMMGNYESGYEILESISNGYEETEQYNKNGLNYHRKNIFSPNESKLNAANQRNWNRGNDTSIDIGRSDAGKQASSTQMDGGTYQKALDLNVDNIDEFVDKLINGFGEGKEQISDDLYKELKELFPDIDVKDADGWESLKEFLSENGYINNNE